MANFLDKFRAATAIDTSTTLDLSCQHITTANWMEGQPAYIKEMVPGESISIEQQTFARLEPLVVPTLGRANIHNRAFFVPMRTIFGKWNEFITADYANWTDSVTGQTDVASTNANNLRVSLNAVPNFYNWSLVKLFCYFNANSGVQASPQTATTYATQVSGSSNADITLLHYSSTDTSAEYYYKLTPIGRRVMKLLQSLGYNVLWTGDVNTGTTPAAYNPCYSLRFSALPLLAYWKVMLDWYYPSQYIGDEYSSKMRKLLEMAVNGQAVTIAIRDLNYFLGVTTSFGGLVNYTADYFTSSFNNPSGPYLSTNLNGSVTAGEIPTANIRDINVIGAVNGGDSNSGLASIGSVGGIFNPNTPYYVPSRPSGSNYTQYITQYGLDSLKALTDYMKRHQLAGSRAMDRLYARFGKALTSEKLDRSYYFGADTIPLQIGDVMSHSDTNGASLGDYAGKGMAYGSGKSFDFNTDEYGYVIIISSIIPVVGYYQGLDRSVLHLGARDFWTPEFDQVGNQAISRLELFMPMNAVTEGSVTTQFASDYLNENLVKGVFGWTPRYAEYKVAKDKLTGDFRYNSMNNVGNTSSAWHLLRQVGVDFQTSDDIVQSPYFVTGYDKNQYNRIFGNVNDTADKFYVIHNFNVTSKAPMHGLFDTYEFESEDEGAKEVTLDANGAKVN